MKRWIIGAVVVVVVLAVGIPFFYIHVIEGKAPAKLSLSSPGGTASVPLDGTWSIATGSVAGYRVGEVLLGQNNTAVGRTTAIGGTLTISGSKVESASFTADMTQVKSDQHSRDNQFQHRIMDTSSFPTATFALTKPFSVSSLSGTLSVTGNLTLRGVTSPITAQVTARASGDQLQVLGDIPITFATWKIPNPSLGGFVTTQDHGTLEFLLDFTKGAPAPTTTAAPSESGNSGPPSPPTLSPTTTPPLGF